MVVTVVTVVTVNLQGGGGDDAQCTFASCPAAAQSRKPVENTANMRSSATTRVVSVVTVVTVVTVNCT
jgi:hypothetical protein